MKISLEFRFDLKSNLKRNVGTQKKEHEVRRIN